MSTLKLFYDFMSQPSRALYIFLKLTNIPFEPCSIPIRKGLHYSDEFKEKFNRFQKVPFIHHGDFKLSESVAIARYLSREYRDKVPNHWYPENSQDQAKIDEYLEWQHLNTRWACAKYFWFKVRGKGFFVDLFSCIAIVRYVKREYRDMIPDHWYPQSSQKQAQVDEYLEWQHVNTRKACLTYFVHKWLIPTLTGSPVDEEEVEKHKSEMLTCLDQIEELWLSQGHTFIASDQISVADIFAACELEQPKMAGFDVTEGRPRLKKYMELVREACNPHYDEAHLMVNKVAKKNIAAKL